MLAQNNMFIVTRPQTINALTKIRREWEQASDGKSLVDVETPVGFLLADVVSSIFLCWLTKPGILVK